MSFYQHYRVGVTRLRMDLGFAIVFKLCSLKVLILCVGSTFFGFFKTYRQWFGRAFPTPQLAVPHSVSVACSLEVASFPRTFLFSILEGSVPHKTRTHLALEPEPLGMESMAVSINGGFFLWVST